MSKVYDVIILGGGPAGLAAGLYCGRSCLDTLLIERGIDGGQIAITDEIENYPGQTVEGESGPSLISRFTEQVEKFGAERVAANVTKVDFSGETKKFYSGDDVYEAKAAIVAPGAFPKPIGCKNENDYMGKGVSYCATCDANFFEDFEVYVVGGGDSAVEEAMYLTKFARKVYLIHRRDELRAAKSIQEKAFKNDKLEILWNTTVKEIGGDPMLNWMIVEDTVTGEQRKIEADEEDGLFGLFGFVGFSPRSDLFEGILDIENGYILTDDDMKTNVPGVFAAGDVRKKSLRQVVTAAADGAIAATQVEKYLADME